MSDRTGAVAVVSEQVAGLDVTGRHVVARRVMGDSGRRPHGGGLAGRLWADWAVVADQQLPVIADWAAEEPALRHCRTAADVLGSIRSQPDATLGALIRLARPDGSEGSEGPDGPDGCGPGSGLADRIVLLAMLPKLIRMARRDPAAELDDYLTQLWLRVRTYPLARRPTRIAANLALDTLKAVQAEQRTIAHPVDLFAPGLPGWVSGGGAPAPRTAADVLRRAGDLGLIDPVTRSILEQVYTEGRSGREVAERLRISPDMVRFRCSRALRALAGRAGELAAA